MTKILVTGACGFIGFHLCNRLLDEGHEILGIDNLNDYYDVNLKLDRKSLLEINHKFELTVFDIKDLKNVKKVFIDFKPTVVIHLAAQAGVRYSIENPQTYIESNIIGSFNLLEACRRYPVEHLLLASTSSVYGANSKLPYNEDHKSDTQMSVYASTKKSMESLAHSYSHLFSIPTTIFRFFTVYGPWGRPDMALYKFVDGILNNTPIDVYNNGNMRRDFTYVLDLVKSIDLLIKKPPAIHHDSDLLNSKVAPYSILNIGNSQPEDLMEYIKCIENSLAKKANINFMPMQQGDIQATAADTSKLLNTINYIPDTSIQVGIANFIDWYLNYHKK